MDVGTQWGWWRRKILTGPIYPPTLIMRSRKRLFFCQTLDLEVTEIKETTIEQIWIIFENIADKSVEIGRTLLQGYKRPQFLASQDALELMLFTD